MGIVCQPSTFSSLELGYAYTPQGQCLPVEEVDLPLVGVLPRPGRGARHAARKVSWVGAPSMRRLAPPARPSTAGR